MIIGIGNDIVDIVRMEKIIAQPAGGRFISRVLTSAEQALIVDGKPRRLAEFAAGRFAIKEAVAKAFGCGISGKLGLQDIEVLPNAAGQPQCRISPQSMQHLGFDAGRMRIHVSITHSKQMAAGFAVIESLEKQ